MTVKSFNILTPFAIVGYIYYLVKDRSKFLLISVVFLSHIYMLFKSADTNHFQLQIHIFICLLSLTGLHYVCRQLFRGWKLSKVAFYSALAIYGLISVFIWIEPSALSKPWRIADNKAETAMVTFNSGVESDAILVAKFWHGVAFAFYTREDIKEELETTMGNGRWVDADFLDEDSLRSLLESGREIYVMESYMPSSAAAIFLGSESIAQRYSAYSLKTKIERMADYIELEQYYLADGVLMYRALLLDEINSESD